MARLRMSDKRNLRAAVAQIKKGPDGPGTQWTSEQRSYIDTWILPLLVEVLDADAGTSTFVQCDVRDGEHPTVRHVSEHLLRQDGGAA